MEGDEAMNPGAAFSPQWLRRILVLRLGWECCDNRGRLRPTWWTRRRWAVLGGVAGYWDFCSRRCELTHPDDLDAYTAEQDEAFHAAMRAAQMRAIQQMEADGEI